MRVRLPEAVQARRMRSALLPRILMPDPALLKGRDLAADGARANLMFQRRSAVEVGEHGEDPTVVISAGR